jgi:hypothetical protein
MSAFSSASDDQSTHLRGAGELLPAERDLDDLPEPLALEPDQEAPSSTLAHLRHGER